MPIDLVMTVGTCGFLDAVNFLNKDFNLTIQNLYGYNL